MKKILNFSKSFLQFILLGFLIIAVITGLTSKYSLAGLKSFVILSGSMQPALPVASVAYVYPENQYVIGDIIAFKNKSGLVITHRIVGIGSTYYRVAGDANNSVDSDPVPATSVIGKIIFHLPYLGRLSNFIRTPIGFVATVAVPALIFIGFELWGIKGEIEKQTEERILIKHGLTPNE